MKVLLELLGDVTQLLSAVDSLDEIRVDSRPRLESLLQSLGENSARLLAPVQEAAAREPARRDELFQRALEAIARDQLDEARAILSSAVRLFPQDAELHNHLGLVAWEQGEIAEAAEHYARGIEAGFPREQALDWFADRNRSYLRAMEGRALALYRLGRNREALPIFEALASMNPADYSGCRYLAGEIRHGDGDLTAAIAEYRLVPVEPAVLYNLGLAYFQDGQVQEAASIFIRAFTANSHIAGLLVDTPYAFEVHGPGYLASEAYAHEFVAACRELWADPSARRFLSRCFEHPLVQSHLRQAARRMVEHALHTGAMHEAESRIYGDLGESTSLCALVEQVLEQLGDA